MRFFRAVMLKMVFTFKMESSVSHLTVLPPLYSKLESNYFSNLPLRSVLLMCTLAFSRDLTEGLSGAYR
jgi:hypothetical protein